MEAYLDWQKKGGIKLNDVIEEYRYVANGKAVKKGDFLTYVGEDVAPATEPPFNAIALSSGVGAPEFVDVEVEVTKTDNIFVNGSQVRNSITTSSPMDEVNYPVENVFDEDTVTAWWAIDSQYVPTCWVKVELIKPIKITKMKFHSGSLTGKYVSTIIQGSNNDVDWDNLHTTNGECSSLTEFTLTAPNFYKYYRVVIRVNKNGSTYPGSAIKEWQVSEYTTTEIQQIPSTEHNEQVMIARPLVFTNLIANGDFGNGLDGWEITNFAKATVTDGKLSISVPSGGNGGQGVIKNLSNIFVENHIYYFSAEAKSTQYESGVTDAEMIYAIIVNGKTTSVADLTIDNEWHKLSLLHTAEAGTSSDNLSLIMYQARAGGISDWDNVVLIDLTEAFGAGNEPTKEWCDANLGGGN